jgi:hypothetical protein
VPSLKGQILPDPGGSLATPLAEYDGLLSTSHAEKTLGIGSEQADHTKPNCWKHSGVRELSDGGESGVSDTPRADDCGGMI